MIFTAVLDTCSLVPIARTDTLLRMAEAGFYRPLWSERILSELQKALENIYPDMAQTGAATKRIKMMRKYFPDALVENWAPFEECLNLPDPNDRHVAAAAIRGQAHVIVTDNTVDFPQDELARFDIDVQSPDEFLLNQLDLRPSETMYILKEQADATRKPEISIEKLLQILHECAAENFANAASKQKWRI